MLMATEQPKPVAMYSSFDTSGKGLESAAAGGVLATVAIEKEKKRNKNVPANSASQATK
jgi:hypothetical protein